MMFTMGLIVGVSIGWLAGFLAARFFYAKLWRDGR